jgi:hypothetical protein
MVVEARLEAQAKPFWRYLTTIITADIRSNAGRNGFGSEKRLRDIPVIVYALRVYHDSALYPARCCSVASGRTSSVQIKFRCGK